MRDYLLNNAPVKFEPQNIIALGSGEGLQLGTHQAHPRRPRQDRAERPRRGDFVYLHFSGHGSTQPALTRHDRSSDGSDEVFLSADTQMAPQDNPRLLPQRADRRRDVGGAEGDPQDRRVRLAGVRFVPFGLDDARRARQQRTARSRDQAARTSAFPTARSRCRRTPAGDGEATSARCRSAPARYGDDAADAEPGRAGRVLCGADQRAGVGARLRGAASRTARRSQENSVWYVHLHRSSQRARQEPEPDLPATGAERARRSMRRRNWLRATPLFEGKLDAQVFGNKDAAAAEQWPT